MSTDNVAPTGEQVDVNTPPTVDATATPAENVPFQWSIETKHLEEHYDSKGYAHITEAGEAPPKKDEEDKWAKYVLTYTRHFNEDDDRYSYSDIEIKSKPLKNILKRVIRDYPGESFATDKVELRLPSQVLLHYRKDLYDVLKEGKIGDEEGREHLKYLLKWYEEEESDLISKYENLIEQGLITYRLLWTIMRPGCTIYAPLHGQPRAFTLTNSWNSREYYVLEVNYTEYDGKKFGTSSTQLRIFPFLGSTPINSLDAYPMSWHSREQYVRETLIKRGRLFESYQGKQYLEYHGIALGEVKNCNRLRYSINGRVMVDCETFSRINTGRAISVSSFPKTTRLDDDDAEEDEDEDDDFEDSGYNSDSSDVAAGRPTKNRKQAPLTDDQCLNATNLVCGFAFNEKRWVEFFIDKLGPIQWNENAFEQLVLPAKQKGLVKALVESHMKDSEGEGGFDDLIKGKGKGLISVLHGPPGVGKTLTAESVAEYTKRPLYAVSSGELGTSSKNLEHNLAQILDVAAVWKAVLLLDEADVFLERRSLHDVDRNALVSIFLRLLEYYQGILFLTTNRVQSFDEAFQSRIHVALKYNDLTASSRHTVWKNFLTKLDTDKLDVDEEGYNILATYELNGRQIKNAVKTAKSLADSTGGKVDRETVETVLDIQRDFDRDFREATTA